MDQSEIEQLFTRYNYKCLDERLRGKMKLRLDSYHGDYSMVSLFVDDRLYKFFSFEEIVGYDYSLFIYAVQNSLQSRYEKAISVPIENREVYSGPELIAALKSYLAAKEPKDADRTNPLIFMFYLLDKRTDISAIDEKSICHKWLAELYQFRLSGTMPKDFYERKKVVLDFASCNDFGDMYREMRIKMKWFLCYGENLDALWDILTGLYYYGDDFIIKRKRTHTYTEYGRTIDYTQTIDKVCEIFGEAALEKSGEMTVTIEYMD